LLTTTGGGYRIPTSTACNLLAIVGPAIMVYGPVIRSRWAMGCESVIRPPLIGAGLSEARSMNLPLIRLRIC